MGETTLQQALDDYKAIYMPYRNFADRTRVEYHNDLEDLAKYLHRVGIGSVAGLGLPIIERYVAQLEERGLASLTRKRKVVAIRSFLSFLYQDGYIGINLAARIVLPFTESSTPHVLTRRECDRLRSACAGSARDAAIFELLLQTGIRLSELVRLTLDDVEMGQTNHKGESCDGFVRILGSRGRKERMMPLDAGACLTLRNYMSTRNETQTSVLFLNRFGEPLGERGVQKVLKKHIKKAAIGRASIHTLRHTFGARRMAAGATLKTIQESMGHKDPRSTSIYASFANYKEVGA